MAWIGRSCSRYVVGMYMSRDHGFITILTWIRVRVSEGESKGGCGCKSKVHVKVNVKVSRCKSKCEK